jgi:hypothetical protein
VVTQVLVGACVVLTVCATATAAYLERHSSSSAYTVGRWVADSAAPGDTLVVAYGHANVLQAAGLRPGYPYAWSLPVRTLDGDLRLLTARLGSPNPPTWLVQWDQDHAWGLDPDGRVAGVLARRYHAAAVVCGHRIWLLNSAVRDLVEAPPTRSCGARPT